MRAVSNLAVKSTRPIPKEDFFFIHDVDTNVSTWAERERERERERVRECVCESVCERESV